MFFESVASSLSFFPVPLFTSRSFLYYNYLQNLLWLYLCLWMPFGCCKNITCRYLQAPSLAMISDSFLLLTLTLYPIFIFKNVLFIYYLLFFLKDVQYYINFGYDSVIWQLSYEMLTTVSYRPSLYKDITVLLILFPVLCFSSPWLIYSWKFVLLYPLYQFCPSPHPSLTVTTTLFSLLMNKVSPISSVL